MPDFVDEIQAQSMAEAGLKRLRLLELCDDLAVEVGRLLESGNRQLDMQLALAWRLRERDCKAIFAKSTRWGSGKHLRALEAHVKSLSDDIEDQDSEESGPRVSSGASEEVLAGLEMTEKGAVRPSLGNIVHILAEDQSWKGRIRLNSFADQVEIDGRPLSDADEAEFSVWITPTYGPDISSVRVHEAFTVVAARNQYHPVIDYLNGLVWDGEKRLDGWVSRYLGAPDSELMRAYARKFLISMIARIRNPGCKVDTSLILYGPRQGEGKSTALAILGGSWFTDTSIEIGHKDGMQSLVGAWLIEVAELDSFAKRENSTVKAYLSSPVDRYRPSYGRNMVRRPRQCVFCGSTNKDEFLNDESGSRRFWVVHVAESVDNVGLASVRDQLFAEADAAYLAGEPWWLGRHEDTLRDAGSDQYRQTDPWEPRILGYLAGDPGAGVGPRRGPFTLAFLMEVVLGMEPKDMSKQQQMRLAAVMKSAGWEKSPAKRPVEWRPRQG